MRRLEGIYALCDNSLNPARGHLELAKALLEGGAPILQLRMKGEKDSAKIRRTAGAILELKSDYEFIFLLNDFVEIGRELPVDGVHVGQDDLAVEKARELLGPGKLIGYSSHSPAEAREAERRGADYVALGAVYPTATKGPGHPIQGLAKLKEVVAALSVPVVAIGGINRSNIGEVAQSGAAMAAMIGALTLAPNVAAETRWFVEEFERRRAKS
ncbi:MAG TPA: thiamine phosphate synthase [bacterium]|nr:thiamine phosphate synthase [bacterium]